MNSIFFSPCWQNLAPGLTLSAGVEATSAKKKEGSEKTSSQELSLAVVGNADFSDDSVKAQTTVRYPLGGSAAVDASVSASFEVCRLDYLFSLRNELVSISFVLVSFV